MSVLASAGTGLPAIFCLLCFALSESAPAWAQAATRPRPGFLQHQGEAEFAADAGAGGTEQLQRITQDPVIAQLLAHLNRRAAVEQTLHYLENIERVLLLDRIETKGKANPLASGDGVLPEEIEKESGIVLDYAESNRSKTVDRFLELVVIAQRAMLDSSRQEELLQWGPGKLMPILEGPLEEHCIQKP